MLYKSPLSKQWGDATGASNVPFPIAFPNSALTVIITDAIGSTSTTYAQTFGCRTTLGANSFYMIGPAGDGALWFALGY